MVTDDDFKKLKQELHSVRVLCLILARLVPDELWKHHFTFNADPNEWFLQVQKDAYDYDRVSR